MRTRSAVAILALLALSVTSCFNPFDPRIAVERATSRPAPVPSTPALVIQLFQWCYEYRDPTQYAQIFTDNFVFVFAPNDSAGIPYRGRPWLREDEVAAATHMFVGGGGLPAASDIQIDLGNSFVSFPDPRPGMNPIWHQTITVPVQIKFTIDENGTPDVRSVVGHALFYLERGDSAAIPPELAAEGFRPDSTRWWIERWEDETAGATAQGASLLPVAAGLPPAPGPKARPAAVADQPMSWGAVKLMWRY